MIVYQWGKFKMAIDEKRISAVIMHDTKPDEMSYIFLNGDSDPFTVDRPFENVLDDLRNLGIGVYDLTGGKFPGENYFGEDL